MWTTNNGNIVNFWLSVHPIKCGLWGGQNVDQNDYIILWQNDMKSSWNYVSNIKKWRHQQKLDF